MEHVADDERAHREILRCLAPGGTYLFTVPFDSGRQGHLRLTQRVGPNMPVLLDKHIHGDPHANSGILAHRIYGLQLLDDLRALGYKAIFKDLNQAAHGIFGGDLFVAEKEH
jgi:SAM-dependent methyltransferase